MYNFLVTGLDKDSYKKISNELSLYNKKNLLFFSAVAVAMFTALFAATFFFQLLESARKTYFIFDSLFLLLLVVNVFFSKNRKYLIFSCVILCMTFSMLFGLCISDWTQPDTQSTSFIVLLFVVSILFTIRPIYQNLVIIFSLILFIALDSKYKSPYTHSVNVTNAISFGILSIITGSFLMRLKLQRLLYIYENKILSESKIKKSEMELNKHIDILTSIAGVYHSLHVIDLVNNTVTEYATSSDVKKYVNAKEDAVTQMKEVMTNLIIPVHRKKVLEFTDLTNLRERMKNKVSISEEFISNTIGWFQAIFIVNKADENGYPEEVIFTTKVIDKQKRREEMLFMKSSTDELTNFFNRNSYEENIDNFNTQGVPEKFVLVSFDVNGLKTTNDTLGHAAGDELLKGAAFCMNECFGKFGSLYRTGGDEFIGLFNVGFNNLKAAIAHFEKMTADWTGELIDTLSVSIGYAYKKDYPGINLYELQTIADKKMYEDKSAYYVKKGIDRRGQVIAYKAICSTYNKILKVNLFTDKYSIITMDEREKTAEKGFADNISTWLMDFAKSGQVHPDDVNHYLKKTDITYLKNYFMENNTSLSIYYRRMIDSGFRKVMMEIIPVENYSSDNQEVYLYVKDIEK